MRAPIIVTIAAIVLGGCSSSGSKPDAPYTSAGDQQCAIAYSAKSDEVEFDVTTTVAGEISYSVVGLANGSDAATNVTVGANKFTEKVTGFRRMSATLTGTDHTVYHCSVHPAS